MFERFQEFFQNLTSDNTKKGFAPDDPRIAVAALCMQVGADGVFVGSGIFKSGDPDLRAKAIVEATTHYQDAEVLARVSAGLGEPMVGISASSLRPEELLETRGW